MSTPQYRGKIKHTIKGYNGISYDRVAPGVTLPHENLSGKELEAMSGAVITYKLKEHNNEN